MQAVLASIATFLISCTMLLALRPLAGVVGLIDRPGGHKTHHGEVPVVGGISMFTGLLVSAIAGSGLIRGSTAMLTVATFMVILGVLDDRFNLPPRVRMLAHASAAVTMIYATGYQVHDLGNLIGTGPVALGLMSVPFTIVAIAALINAFNMLDGLDGLAGSTGLVALGGLVVLSAEGHSSGTLVISSCMFGAVAAFLIFNLPTQWNRKVRTFMGDAGSTLLGFLLAAICLEQTQQEVMDLSPVVVLWLMPIPIFELFTTMGRRLIRGVSPTLADTSHFHHRLIQAGLSVRAVCALYFLLSLTGCAFGLWANRAALPEPLMFGGFCLAFMLWLMFVATAQHVVDLLPPWARRQELAADH